MRVRRAVLAAIVATAALSVPAGAVPGGTIRGTASPDARQPAGFWSRLARQDDAERPADPARAWRESVADVLKRRTPFAEVETTTPSAKTVISDDVGVAGDIDGDRRADVAVITQTYLVAPNANWRTDHIDVDARRGTNGARLWSARIQPPAVACEHQCESQYSYVGAYTAYVDGAPGIEIVSAQQLVDAITVPAPGLKAFAPDWSELVAFDVIVVDRHGRARTLRHLDGRIRHDGGLLRIEHLPLVSGVSASIEPGPEDDWAYLEANGPYLPSQGSVLGTELPSVDGTTVSVRTVSGRTGAVRQVATRGASLGAEDLTVVPDANGDRADDLALSPSWAWEAPRNGHRAPVTVLGSRDGATVWSRPAGDGNVYIGAAGDTTGDGADDVMLLMEPFPLDKDHDAIPSVLVSGRTGTTLWQRGFSGGYPIGDVDHDGRAEVLLVTLVRSGAQAALDLAAYDGRNHRAYARRVALTGSTAAYAAGAYFDRLGDLNGDGVGDVELGAVTERTTKTENTVTVTFRFVPLANLSGRTGGSLPRVRNALTLLDTVDGRGDDIAVVGATGVRLRDGRTGVSLLYLDFGIAVEFGWAQPGRLDGDRCADLLASGYTETGLVYGLVSGSTGRTVWQVARGDGAKARIKASGRAYRCH